MNDGNQLNGDEQFNSTEQFKGSGQQGGNAVPQWPQSGQGRQFDQSHGAYPQPQYPQSQYPQSNGAQLGQQPYGQGQYPQYQPPYRQGRPQPSTQPSPQNPTNQPYPYQVPQRQPQYPAPQYPAPQYPAPQYQAAPQQSGWAAAQNQYTAPQPQQSAPRPQQPGPQPQQPAPQPQQSGPQPQQSGPQSYSGQPQYPSAPQESAHGGAHRGKTAKNAKVKGKRRKPKWWVILISIVVALALVFGIASVAGYYMLKADGAIDGIMADSTMPTKEQAYAGMPNGKYEFKDPIAVDTYYEFKTIMKDPVKIRDTVKMGQSQLDGVDLQLDDCARVYQDSSFAVPVPTSTIASSPFDEKEGAGTLILSGAMNLPENMQHGDSIGKEYGFLPSNGYYYVQYVAPDGKKLAKPIVQFFRVKEHTGITRLPQVNNVTPVVNKDGGVDISWDKVDGAKSYNVYIYTTHKQIGKEGDENYMPESHAIDKLGSTDKTQLLSADYDKPKSYSDETLGTSVQQQNIAFRSLAVEHQDSIDHCQRSMSENCAQILQDAGGLWDADSAGRLYFVVTAVDEAGNEGLWHAIDANDLVPSIPIGQAEQAQIDQWGQNMRGVFGEENTVEEDMQTYIYTFVEMANGATVTVPSTFSDLKSDGKNGWTFIYSAPGTKLKDTGRLYYEGDLNPVFAQVTKAATDALPKAGGMLDRIYSVGKVDWSGYDTKKIDSDTKESPLFNYASTDFGKYLANNLLNGHEVIDISKYASDAYQTSTADVMTEVMYQNPYISIVSNGVNYTVRRNGDKTVMWVKYPDGYQQRQKAVEDTAKAAVSQFQGSDRDKAVAIDRFLTGKMEYDYDASNALGKDGIANAYESNDALNNFPDAWSSYGMVSGKGVCLSYAYSYQILAKEAGLDSRVVSGNVAGTKAGHAWNYVKVDGQWLLIDPTWDDDGTTTSDKYQLKRPSEVTDHYASSDGWTLASEVGQYSN